MRPLAAPLLLAACASALLAQMPEAKPPLRVLVACTKGQLAHYEAWLTRNYNAVCLWAGDDNKKADKGGKPVTGLEQCDKADVMLLNLYRVSPSDEQLAHAKKFFASGKGVVGLRKASHAFQNWLAVDRELFGAKYGGHYFDDRKAQVMTVEPAGKKSPLVGEFKPFLPGGGLYRYTELAPEIEVLISGGPPGKMVPQVWARVNPKTKTRVFYSRYDPKDLEKDEGCRLMTARALFWAAGREVEAKPK